MDLKPPIQMRPQRIKCVLPTTYYILLCIYWFLENRDIQKLLDHMQGSRSSSDFGLRQYGQFLYHDLDEALHFIFPFRWKVLIFPFRMIAQHDKIETVYHHSIITNRSTAKAWYCLSHLYCWFCNYEFGWHDYSLKSCMNARLFINIRNQCS